MDNLDPVVTPPITVTQKAGRLVFTVPQEPDSGYHWRLSIDGGAFANAGKDESRLVVPSDVVREATTVCVELRVSRDGTMSAAPGEKCWP